MKSLRSMLLLLLPVLLHGISAAMPAPFPQDSLVKKAVSRHASYEVCYQVNSIPIVTTQSELRPEAAASGQLLASYGWSPQRDNGVAPLFARIPERDALGNTLATYRYAYYHNDHLGTPQRLTDRAGNILWAADYDAYGKAKVRVNSSQQLAAPQALRLPGQIADPETGLHYNDRRYYDPDTGRYLTRDPIGFEGGINLVTYAGASPSRFTDPTGEFVQCLMVNYARCLVTCGIEGAATAAITGDCLDLGDLAKDCLTNCLWSMLPIPDPCGRFGKLFSIGVGMMGGNSFEADTLVHTRVLTDTGYVKQLKRIADIQVGDEVLAWDELKAYDIAQAREAKKLQAHLPSDLQAKSASSPAQMRASSYENNSKSEIKSQTNSSFAASQQTAESYQKVTHLKSISFEQTLYHITLDNGETFQATEGHPFKTSEGWRDAIMLKKGGKLLLKGGDADSAERFATIIYILEEVKTIPVYNLEVEQLHTYFIGQDGVLVHNARSGTSGENAAAAAGRAAHEGYLPPGFTRPTLPSGRKPDAVNMKTGVVVEFKPNNARQFKRGCKQVQGYVDELRQSIQT
jgi:RHS repeat-associated protein